MVKSIINLSCKMFTGMASAKQMQTLFTHKTKHYKKDIFYCRMTNYELLR